MNNFKKIGLTALAGSLVATSVYAGEISVAGSASWRISNHAGTEGGKTMAMGNQLTFTGGGEMDNGMNVALSFILDQGDNTVDAELKLLQQQVDHLIHTQSLYLQMQWEQLHLLVKVLQVRKTL